MVCGLEPQTLMEVLGLGSLRIGRKLNQVTPAILCPGDRPFDQRSPDSLRSEFLCDPDALDLRAPAALIRDVWDEREL